jgi:hypothetical protein
MPRFVDMIFAPLARLLVARGLLFGEVAERLKLHYLRAAKGLAGPRATDSRLSVMTGLQRRDITRLAALPDDAPSDRKVNHLSRLVQFWQTDPRFAGRALARAGGEDSFVALAQSIRRDVHPRTMIEQLREAGTISITDNDSIRLEQTSYQPLAGTEAQLDYLADNAGDFLAASTGNVLAATAPFFERAAHFNQLSPEAVAQLEAAFRVGEMALLQSIARQAAKLQTESPGTHRFRAGGYFYSTDVTGKES